MRENLGSFFSNICLIFYYSEANPTEDEDYPLKEAKTFGEAAAKVMKERLDQGLHDETFSVRKTSEPNTRMSFANKLFKACSELENISDSFRPSISEDSEFHDHGHGYGHNKFKGKDNE
jgi:hypothetical protein